MYQPLVSVIIPTYKRPKFLLETLESVFNQTYPNIEVIVVDDNEENSQYQKETENKLNDLIKANRIQYIKHKVNKNGSAARNTGLRYSKGQYINFLDDDDFLLPQKIELQVNKLLSTSDEYGATYCNRINVYLNIITKKIVKRNTTSILDGNIYKEYLLSKCEFGTSNILFKRECIEKLNGFDETYIRHQDIELMTRFFAKEYLILCTSQIPLVIYDTTKDRSNFPNATKDYLIKNKYLNQFRSQFEYWGIWNEVSKHFWLECVRISLRTRNYDVYRKAIQNIYKSGHLKFRELIVIIKSYLSGLSKIIS